MTELSLIETETLLTEVFARFDACVFMGVQKRTQSNQDTYYRRWGGEDATCLGLVELLKGIIKGDYLKEMEK